MKKIKLVLVLFAIFALPLISLPDPPGPPGGGGGNPGSGGGVNPVGAPIDGGLGILLALGLGYGGKKLYNARKHRHDSITQPKKLTLHTSKYGYMPAGSLQVCSFELIAESLTLLYSIQ